LKVSIITVAYNSELTIRDTMESVLIQTYSEIEYIIVDGFSGDNTLPIIKEYQSQFNGRMHWISEKDKGIYDAINKGIELASGDIIGILNSDDTLADNNTVACVVEAMLSNDIGAIWGDVLIVDKADKTIIKRYYSAKNITINSFNYGIMPPHPGVFIKSKFYKLYGKYNIKYKIAADYDLLLRYFKINNLNFTYIPKVLVEMKAGGISSRNIFSIISLNKEIYEIHNDNGISISLFSLMKKIPYRLLEMISRPI